MKNLFAIDFANNTIVASKTTLKKASIPNSAEYKALMKLMKQNPTFTVAERNKPLRCVRIAETMAAYDSNYIKRINENTYNAMAYALQRIEARVAGE